MDMLYLRDLALSVPVEHVKSTACIDVKAFRVMPAQAHRGSCVYDAVKGYVLCFFHTLHRHDVALRFFQAQINDIDALAMTQPLYLVAAFQG